MVRTASAAARLGVSVVNGFTGSAIWHLLYSFPPVLEETVVDGFRDFADRWTPILDAFDAAGVKFALEVHPTEIAYDSHTFARAIDTLDGHAAFGADFDPSHLIWQVRDFHPG